MKNVATVLVIGVVLLGVSTSFAGLYAGSLSSTDGMTSGGQTWASPPGFQVVWEVEQTDPQTWHYKYWFTDESGGDLSMKVSHIIISLSENIQQTDLFNFGTDVDVDENELGKTFDFAAGNPGFPEFESIFGIKINMTNDQLVAEFDSTRQPMWGDFYAKDGGQPKNYAYNSDLGKDVADPHNIAGAFDFSENMLYKISVPNTVPEPATLLLLGLGSMMLRKRRA